MSEREKLDRVIPVSRDIQEPATTVSTPGVSTTEAGALMTKAPIVDVEALAKEFDAGQVTAALPLQSGEASDLKTSKCVRVETKETPEPSKPVACRTFGFKGSCIQSDKDDCITTDTLRVNNLATSLTIEISRLLHRRGAWNKFAEATTDQHSVGSVGRLLGVSVHPWRDCVSASSSSCSSSSSSCSSSSSSSSSRSCSSSCPCTDCCPTPMWSRDNPAFALTFNFVYQTSPRSVPGMMLPVCASPDSKRPVHYQTTSDRTVMVVFKVGLISINAIMAWIVEGRRQDKEHAAARRTFVRVVGGFAAGAVAVVTTLVVLKKRLFGLGVTCGGYPAPTIVN